LSVTVKLTLRPDVDDVIAIGDDGSKVPIRRVTPVQQRNQDELFLVLIEVAP